MAGLRPNKGTAPATGKVKPTRAEQLMSATHALAVEQLPDLDTMTAIEEVPRASGRTRNGPIDVGHVERGGGSAAASGAMEGGSPRDPASQESEDTTGSAASRPVDAPDSAGFVVAEARSTVHLEVRDVVIAEILPSPFQPKGRPSSAATESVRAAIEGAGSLEALVGPDGATLFLRLTPEAARLAELAYDVQVHGLRVPVDVRRRDDGTLECLSGHRRLAAAALAGFPRVPTIDRGAMSNAAAAATVLRGNLHRENFTTWQEATLVSDVQDRRRADGYRDNVRSLGAVMGWSHGKVNMLLRIRRSLSPTLLARAGGGDAAPIEERLARTAYRDLERLAAESDDDRRLGALRRLLGIGDVAPSARERQVCVLRPKRGGGFVIDVSTPVEALEAGDATLLRAHLETQLTRVNARLASLGHAL